MNSPVFFFASLLLAAAALLLAWQLTTWVHELGHVVFGRIAGYRARSCGTGTGGRTVAVRLCGVIFFVGTKNVGQGITFCEIPKLAPETWRRVLYAAGGILANLLAAALLYWLVRRGTFTSPVLRLLAVVFAAFNLLNGLVNFIPISVRVGRTVFGSDGRLILNALLRRSTASMANAPNTARQLAPFFARIGDTASLAATLTDAARFWAMLGRADVAGRLLAEADRLAADLGPVGTGLRAYTRGWVADLEGRIGDVDRELGEAVDRFTRAGDPGGQLLATLALAGHYSATGRTAEADGSLDRAARIPGKGAAVSAARESIVNRSAARTGDAAAAEKLLARVSDPAFSRVDPTSRAALWREYARAFEAGGLWEHAWKAYRLAGGATADAARQLTVEEDQALAAETIDRLSALAREAAVRSGHDPASSDVADRVAAAARAAAGDLSQHSRQRRLFRAAVAWGCFAAAAGVVVCAGLMSRAAGAADRLSAVRSVAFIAGFGLAWGAGIWLAQTAGQTAWRRIRGSEPKADYGTRAFVGVAVATVAVPSILLLVVPTQGPIPIGERIRYAAPRTSSGTRTDPGRGPVGRVLEFLTGPETDDD